jgi:hypothetical protein
MSVRKRILPDGHRLEVDARESAAGDELLVPAIDDGLRLGARCRVGNLPLGIDGLLPERRWPADACQEGSGGA